MATENKTESRGIGFLGLLQVAFIVLKLTHVINWSWWWVLAPIWGVILAALVIIGIVAAFLVASK